MKKIISDGGRKQAGFTHEESDCTVRTLAHIANLSYPEAHEIMKEAGRKDGECSSVYNGLVEAQNLGKLRFHRVEVEERERIINAAPGFVGCTGKPLLAKRMMPINITQFVRQHSRGRYVVRIKQHVFALIDGVMYDAYKQHGGALVQAAWEVRI